jgi:methylthioribose-1-phosphate isomerase
MSTETESPNILLPLALIAATFAILLGSQVGSAKQSSGFMKWQRETLEKQITNMQATDKQAADAIKNREGVVKQSGELQNQLQTLLNELLDLAKDDKDAQEIIKKWNVQRNAPPAAAGDAAAPAAPAGEKPAEKK